MSVLRGRYLALSLLAGCIAVTSCSQLGDFCRSDDDCGGELVCSARGGTRGVCILPASTRLDSNAATRDSLVATTDSGTIADASAADSSAADSSAADSSAADSSTASSDVSDSSAADRSAAADVGADRSAAADVGVDSVADVAVVDVTRGSEGAIDGIADTTEHL